MGGGAGLRRSTFIDNEHLGLHVATTSGAGIRTFPKHLVSTVRIKVVVASPLTWRVQSPGVRSGDCWV